MYTEEQTQAFSDTFNSAYSTLRFHCDTDNWETFRSFVEELCGTEYANLSAPEPACHPGVQKAMSVIMMRMTYSGSGELNRASFNAIEGALNTIAMYVALMRPEQLAKVAVS